jgi:hypothetical protein
MAEDQDKASEKPPKRGKKESTKGAVAAGAAAVGAAAGLTASELIGQGGSEEHVVADPADFDSASFVTGGAAGVAAGSGSVQGYRGDAGRPPAGRAAHTAEGRPGAPAGEETGSAVLGNEAQAGAAAGQAADLAQDAMGHAMDTVQDAVSDAADAAGGLLTDIGEGILDTGFSIAAAGRGAGLGIDMAIDALDEGAIPEAVADVADVVAGEGGRRAVELAIDSTEIAADRVSDEVSDFADRLGADIEHGTRELIENPGEALVDGYWTATDAIFEASPGKLVDQAIHGMDEGAIPDAAGDVWNAAGDAAQAVGRAGADAAGAAQDAAGGAIGAVEDAADAAEDAAEDVGEAIGDAAEDTGEAIGDAAEDTGEAIGDAIGDGNPFD